MSQTPASLPAQDAPEPTYDLLTAPREGVPDVVDTPDAWAATIASLAAGDGPVAVDTERAQSFRYTAKAYLIQLRRAGSGTHLIDPIALAGGAPRADLSPLATALGDAEWIIHAATQDLPCLAEVGLVPQRLFDTELAGRLLGLPRVSLGALLERALGTSLKKEHSAADWSRRPLPEDWLAYAALDVELLVELREWTVRQLDAAGKRTWAEQEFAWLASHAADAPARREDPWRRTSGLHDVRTPRGYAYVRELWHTRDELAERLDRAPGRVVSDQAITELAVKIEAAALPRPGREVLRQVRGFSWRTAARFEANWLAALDRASALTRADLPPVKVPSEGPPPPRTWANRHADAFERWNRVRPATLALAETWSLPVENLVSPDAIRRLVWQPPAEVTTESVDAFLSAADVRPWQRELVVETLTDLLDP